MVKEVQAFAADDGTIFSTRAAALEHDAMEQLKKLDCFNHGSALAVIANAEEIVKALEPIVRERNPAVALDA